ncbi:hypothetical protein GGR58DRAFT_475755 [Xylaria digitata]|nr:hypothetical protein GGR58DRAFT_475755 [Xylaria digitata]
MTCFVILDLPTLMVHTKGTKGKMKEIPMPYRPQGQCPHTTQREKVTKCCPLALEKEPTATLIFDTRWSASISTFESVVWKYKFFELE